MFVDNCVNLLIPRKLRFVEFKLVFRDLNLVNFDSQIIREKLMTVLLYLRRLFIGRKIPIFFFGSNFRIFIPGNIQFDGATLDFPSFGIVDLKKSRSIDIDLLEYVDSFRRHLTFFINSALSTYLSDSPFRAIWLSISPHKKKISGEFSVLGFDTMDITSYVDESNGLLFGKVCCRLRRRLFLGMNDTLVSLEQLLSLRDSSREILDAYLPIVRDFAFRAYFVENILDVSPKDFIINGLELTLSDYYNAFRRSLLKFAKESHYVVLVYRHKKIFEKDIDRDIIYFPATLLFPSMTRQAFGFWVRVLGLDRERAKEAYESIINIKRSADIDFRLRGKLKDKLLSDLSWLVESLNLEVL